MLGSKASVVTFGFGHYSTGNLAVTYGFGNGIGGVVWTPNMQPRPPRRRNQFSLQQNRQTNASLKSFHKQKPFLTLLRTTPPELGE